MFVECGLFFCIYTALREDAKKQTKREKSKSTTENLRQHSALCHFSCMHDLEWLFLCPGSVGELKSFTDLSWHLDGVHASPCAVAVDGRKTDRQGKHPFVAGF